MFKIFHRQGERPILSLSEEALREVIHQFEEREISPRLPDLSTEKVLEIAPRHQSLVPLLRKKGAKILARVGGSREKELGSAPEGAPTEEGSFVLSHWESLPFPNDSWDFILLRTSFSKIELGKFLREATRVLKSGGDLILSELHPFSSIVQTEHAKTKSHEEGLPPGFERYLHLFQDLGLHLQWVKESFLKQAPFLIQFFLTKE